MVRVSNQFFLNAVFGIYAYFIFYKKYFNFTDF